MNLFPKLLRRCVPFFAAVIFLLAAVGSARAVNLVQEFYLPMPEAQINQANNAIISGTSTSINSIFSIVVTGTGTVIYYDQWEDGYEVNLASPTQATTQIWGDGNTNNGVAPGYPNDILPVGAVITLTNVVPQPRNPSTILWDARDRIAANKALVISRAAWPTSPGPVFGGAAGVLSTIDYGTNYISPVGQNITNNLFKYVGMFIMAAQNNTTVTIDPNGTGVGTTSIVLNQGESYLVNGGVMVGGRVTATKAIQADLVIGHVGASYAADWFTLYPASEWSSSYYTPVGSAAKVAQPAYVYLYNPNTNPITVRCTTQVVSTNVVVPGTNGVYQFQMPVGSGANFTTTNAQNFYALCTVAANNSSDTSYNWGFTLVPASGLTTEATVGWGPGSADGTVNGSPVWITALANTTLYVDYKGDHAGPLSYTNNGIILNYDTNFTITALQSLKIFDPSKNQTGMRVFTVDGTLLAGAWGEDPDTAAPGNPYIDAGTTVIPFPVPTLIKSVSITTDAPPTGLSLNDILTYSVKINNQGLLPLGNTVVIDAPSGNLSYVTNSTTLNGVGISDNGTNFPLAAPTGYTIPIILSQGSSTFKYQVKVIGSGTVSNSVNIGGTTIIAQTVVPPGITNASLSLRFTDTNGVPVTTYAAGTNIYVTMTNVLGNTSSNTIQTINVTVVDLTSGDLQTITLTETSTNSGVFRNITGLPTSTSSGIPQQDGILNVAPADTLQVAYIDPVYLVGDTNTASILVPTLNKQLYLTANGTPGNQLLNRVNPSATAGHGTTYTSVDIGSGVGSITVLSTNSATNGPSVSTMTLSNVVVPAASSELLLVGVSFNPGSTVSGITYGAKSLSLVTRSSDNNLVGAEIWGLTNPPVGTTNVVISFASAATSITAGALVLSGVNQTTPYSATSTNLAASSTPTVAIASAVGEMVFNSISVRGATAASPSGSGQVKYWGLPSLSGTINFGAVSLMPGAGSVTNSWTTTSGTSWSSCAVSIKPAAGGGGPTTNTTSFVQTPAFQLPFTMPVGGLVSITNFITITNGAAALAASPNLITATLRTNGVNFLTLTNTTLVGNTNLIWSGLLGSSITIPTNANATITYVISNNVANSAFHINYDTTNNSSEIVLPATTVINIVSNGVYDAPYPGGTLINSPVAGSTVYLRTAVSDPFGYYDITSLDVNVTGPASLSTNLTDVNVVFTSGAVKIYEYAVVTGPSTGTYNIAVTANEGTEGVNVSAATSITTTFLDLGTPSITSFTASPNGVNTNSYPANSPVSVRVSDLNRNTNSATIDSVSVLVTNSAGDYETLLLVETGTNTGIFTNSLTVSTNVVGLPNNGALYAPVTSVLTVYYSDPTDPTDNTSATATVQPPAGVPGVVMNKTVLSPSGGQVGVSNNITFNLQAVNVGSTTLPSLSFSDTFPTNKLRFVSASLLPNVTNASGILTWTNLGALTPGQSTNITVTFFTLATGATTNFATANGSTATNTSSVTFAINNTALNVTKILLSPTNTPVAVGSNVVFRITVQNTGNVTVNYLPMEDAFSAAYYQFVSSTITNNGSGAGSLIWTNLASPTALVAGATITNDVTMKVVGQGSPANNTATVDFATDINGNPVPTTSSTIGVTTASASVNGHVYNDINQSGVFTNGDTGLANVTLQLYTDPNGDGNPSDGTLVQITTTDGNGYYELLNLSIGKYVVVETDLSGYSSSSPVNNRLSINATNLTAFTNANFFDYIPAPSVYSTISGAVWNDANGNGTNNVGETNLPNVTIDLVQDVNSNGIADAGEPIAASATTAGTNGAYTFSAVTPGRYVIRETDLYGYYSTGASVGTNFNQIAFVSTNGIVSTNNNFYDRLSPIAYPDTVAALYFVATNIFPLTNDVSPNGDPLIITNASSTNGLVAINVGSTNITFTPTNLGVTTITYVIADAHGGTSTNTITVNVTELADLRIGKSAAATVFATSNLSYTISVTNFGPTPASAVVVTDALPAGVTFVSATGGGVSNNNAVAWSVGTLTNNQITNLTLVVTAPVGGSLTNIASVSSPTPDPNPTNSVSPPVTTSVTPVTDVQVLNVGPTNVIAGTTYTNTISVTNAGPSSATNVVVVDTRPDGTLVTNTIPVLPAGSGTNFIVTSVAPGSGPLTNSATGTSTTFDPNPGNNTNIVAVTAVTASADVGLGKSALPTVFAASNLSYTISVTNFGPSSASSVVVTDTLPLGVTFVSATGGGVSNNGVVNWSLGTLANNQITNLTLIVTAPASGNLTNVASVNTPTSDPNPTNNTNPPVTTSVTPVANVGLGKTAAATVFAASNLSYTISVTNFGPSSASSVVVTDTLPVGVTFVSATAGGVTNAGSVNWSLGTLTNNQVTNLTLIVTAPVSGSLTNIASVNTPTSDPNLTNNVTPPVITSVTPVADVGLGKSALPTVFATSNLSYTISVTNFGPSSASSVVVTDTLPPSVSFVSATGGGVSNNGVVNWNLGTLANNQVTNLTLIVTAPASGSLTNVASVSTPTGDPNPTNNTTPPVTTSVTPVANIAVGKTGPAAIGYGVNFNYTVSVTNFGPSTATGISVTDSLPAGLIFVSSIPAAATNASNQVIWTNLANLASGTTSNLTLTVNCLTHGSVTNIASAGTPLFDPNPTNNTSVPVVTTITNTAPVAVNQSVVTPEDVATNIVVHGNDVDSTNLTYAILVGPTNGTLGVLNTNTGAVSYLGATNFNGGDSFTFTVFDGSLYATGTVAIVVTPVNDAPVAVNQSVVTPEDVATNIVVHGNDVDSTNLTYAILVGPTNGTLGVLNTNTGAVSYLGATNFNGGDSFTFTVFDGSLYATGTVAIVVTPVNDAPVAVNQSVVTPEDVATNIVVHGNDVDSTNLTYAILVGPTNGTLGVLNTNTGAVSYLGATNFNGGDSFTFTVFDGSLYATGTVAIVVTPVNDAPVAVNQSVVTPEDVATNIVVHGNDVDSTNLTYAILVGPTNGTLGVLNTNTGAVSYLGATNFNGGDSFTFTVFDGSLYATGTVAIVVTPVNDAPVAVNQSVVTPEDVATNIVVHGNDVDSTNLTYAILVGPTNGTLGVLNTNTGAVSYLGATNFNGGDSFTFTVFDGSLYATGTVAIVVTPVNDAPVAVNQSVVTPEDVATNIVVHGNDVDSTNLTYAILVGPTNGTLGVLNTNTGAVSYLGATNFNGGDSFTFTVFDGSLYATGTVAIVVTPVNDAPVAVNQSVVTPEDVATNIVVHGNDVDSTNLTYAILVGPTNGTLGVLNTNTGAVSYLGATNFNGGDSFTFTVFDGSLYATGTVAIVVTPVNDAPVAVNQSVVTPEDVATNIVVHGNDVDSTNLTYAILVGPTNGTLGVLNTNTGAVSYLGATNFNGGDSFTFTVFDGSLYATGTVAIVVTPVNDAPVAVNQSVVTPEDVATNIVVHGNDVDSTNLTYAILVGPTNGTLGVLNTNTGAVSYLGATNFNGGDSFTFTVFDGSLYATGTVAIVVTPVNDAPVAVNQSVVTPEDVATNIVVHGNDVDSTNLTYAILVGPTNGTLGVLNTNTGAVSYLGATNFNGGDSFTFTVFDGSLYATGTVAIVVTPVNDAPVAVNQSVVTPEDVATNIVVHGNDVDSTNLTYAILVGPTNGTLGVLNTNTGAVSYLGATNFNGGDSFTFTVFDGSLYATGTVAIVVTPVNDAPVAVNQSVVTPEDVATNIVVHGNDVDSTNLTYAILVGPTNGTLGVLNTNTGAVSYLGATNFNGGDSFTFTVFDGSLYATGTVAIVVTPVNDAPVAVNQSVVTPEDVATNIVVHGNDVDSTNLTYAILVGPTNGTLGVLNTNTGAVSYLGATNFNGGDSFTFTVFDGSLYATGTVAIVVTPVNDAPVAVNQSVVTPEDVATNIVVHGNDVDSTNLTYAILVGPTNGTLGVLNTNTGAVSYLGATNFNGGDSFTFTVFDGSLYATGTVAIVVTPVNDAPVAVNQSVVTPEDVATNIVVHGNDVDSTNLTYAILVGPTNGTLGVLNTNTGAVSYLGATNFNGGDSFTFTVFDGSLYATGTVAIVVTPVNDAPVAVNQSVVTPEDVATNIVVHGNDVDSTNLTYAILVGPTNGTLGVLNTNTGAVSYLGATNFNGGDSFTFTVFDGSLYATGTVAIVVTPVNDAPVAVNQSVVTPEDVATNIVVHGNDVDSTNLTYAILVGPTNGTLGVLNTNTGAVSYLGATNFNGGDSFTFTVFDGSLYATGTVAIVVTPVNDAPVAVNQSVVTPEDVATNIVVHGNDVDSTNLTYAILVGPTNGTLGVLNTNTGAVSYLGATNFNGGDSFTFTVFDGSLYATGTVAIVVTPVNDAPVAVNQSVVTPEDVATNIVVHGNDVDSTNLTYAILVGPTNGTLGVLNTNTGAVSYLGATNFNGGDSFTFTVFDGSLYATGTVAIVVTPVNDAPVAVNQSVVTPEDVATNIVVHGNDVDSTNLTYAILVGPTNGTLGVLNTNTGAVSYLGATNFNGGDSFTFTVFDGSLYATGTVAIVVTPVNDAPVAVNQSVVTPEDVATNIVVHGNDVDSTNLTYAILVGPTNGTLGVLNTNTGAVSYLGATNFNGGDSFTFTVFDGSLYATGTVAIVVTPVNDAPVAVNQSVVTPEDVATNIVVHGNDVDSTNLTYAILVGPTNGTLGVLNTNTGAVSYLGATNFNGGDSFTFTVFDGSLYATGTVAIVVTPVNDAPVAVNQSVVTPEDVATNIVVHGNDVDSTNLTYAILVGPTNGTLGVLNTNTGAVSYLGATNFNGGDSFTFTVFDGSLYATGTVAIVVTPVNDAPVAVNQSVVTPEDVATNIVVHGNDVDSTNLTYAILVGPTNGTLGVLNTNTGAVSYLGATNFNGGDSFTFTVFDGSLYATGTVAIVVTPVNDAPVAVNQSVVTPEDVATNIVVHGNDVDSTNLTYAILVGPTNGTLGVLNTNTGAVSYLGATNFNGGDSFTFTVFDGSLYATGTVAIVVTPVNDAPVAVNQSVVTPEDVATNIVVHGNDVDSTNLTYAILVGPTNGTLGVLNTNTGAVSYLGATNFNGGDSFTFTVFDGSLYATGTVAIVVTPVNDAPVANAQSVSTPQNTSKPVTLTGSDVENSPLTFIIVTSPTHGTLTLLNTNTGAVTYTPTNNYVGSDSFTFRVNDGQSNSLPATVSITVSSSTGADVQVTLSGPTLVTVGDVFSFTNVITNAGPATAVNTRVTNALPANLVFASATGGGVYSNGVVTWPVFASLTNGQATNLIVSVKTTTSGSTITPTANPLNFLLTNAPPTVSSTTNRASAFATTFDPNLTNNIASLFYTNAQAQTQIVPGAFSVVMLTNTYPTNAVPTNTITPIGNNLFIVGTSAFNPQTQLYEEFVTVTNIGRAPVHALRLSIGNLRSGVRLYNATGTNNGVAYVEYDPPYDSPLNPYPQANSSVTFTLEFFVSDRRPFTNSLTAVAIEAPVNQPVNGVQVSILQSGFNDQRNPGNPRFLVQFSSVPGRTYTVQYTDDLLTWRNATPSIIASATSTFWYDDGPPVTVSPPTYPNSSRFYRVLLNP